MLLYLVYYVKCEVYQCSLRGLKADIIKNYLSIISGLILYTITARLKLPMKVIGNMKAIVNNRDLAKLLMSDNRSSGTKVPIAFIYSMLNSQIEIEASQFNKCPFLLVHPENDLWTDISLSRLFFDNLNCEKELVMLTGAGHFPIEPKGCKQLEIACTRFIEKYSK